MLSHNLGCDTLGCSVNSPFLNLAPIPFSEEKGFQEITTKEKNKLLLEKHRE